MYKKLVQSAVAMALAASLLVGCASAPVTATPIEKHTDYVTEEMYAEATKFLAPDLTRLAAVMRKAERGEEITVVSIGGSITEGFNATDRSKDCYAQIMGDWWEERFPETKVNVVNRGIGGTSSYLGVHRVYDEVLSLRPDLVVVEFSVNDGNDSFYEKSYDNLVRRIMKEEYNPAVMLLFTVQENGTSAQGNDSMIGFRYQLPMISYGGMVMKYIKDGELTWKDVSNDTVHPNDRGHATIGELFYNYFNNVYASLSEIPEDITPFEYEVVTKEVYQNADFVTAADIEADSLGSFEKKQVNWYYQDNWYTDDGAEPIRFTVDAANIGIAFQREVNKGFGIYDVYVDGQCVVSLDGDFSDGWGSTFETREVYTSDACATHVVELKKSDNANSKGDSFGIVGLLLSK